jgi:hypothetical protein
VSWRSRFERSRVLDAHRQRSSRIERGERLFLSREVAGPANTHTEMEVLE